MLESKEILILSYNHTSILTLVRAFGISGYKINLLADYFPLNFSRSKYIKSFTRFDHNSADEEILELITQLVLKTNPKVLLGADVWANCFIAKYKNELSALTQLFPLPDLGNILIADDKWEMSKFCLENGISQPKSILLGPELNNIPSDFRFPALLKPAQSKGGVGIIKVNDREEYDRKILEAFESSRTYMLQEFIVGGDIDVSFFAMDGEIINYTIQREVAKVEPYLAASEIQFEENRQLLEIARKVAKALNWSGVAHLDFVYEEKTESYFFLELNARFWNSLLASEAMGINFPQLCVEYLQNEEIKPNDYKKERYYNRKISITRLIKRRYKWRNTLWYYIMRDPIPELCEKFPIMNRFFSDKELKIAIENKKEPTADPVSVI